MFQKHRLRVSIRTQLIALVLFVAMFSLLVLAIVTGVYFTNVLIDTRVSKLELVAELRSSQFRQSLTSYYYEIYQLSEKENIQNVLTQIKAGNTSSGTVENAQATISQTLDASTSLLYASLYDVNLNLVTNVSNTDEKRNASSSTLNSLCILEEHSTIPDGLLENGGYIEGPIADDDEYYLSFTLPIYTNQSILVSGEILSGYLTVIIDLENYNTTNTPSTEYSSINYILPTHPYDKLENYTGFRYAFTNEYLDSNNVTTDTVFNISKFQPARNVFYDDSDLGNLVDITNPMGMKVSLGYSSIDLNFALWMVTVEQVESDFERPITKLIKIMIGLCIGLAAFMCIITFPLAHYGVRPILKLQKATEDITDRRGLKKKKKKRHVGNPFQKLQTIIENRDLDEKTPSSPSNEYGNNNPSGQSGQSISPVIPIFPISPISPNYPTSTTSGISRNSKNLQLNSIILKNNTPNNNNNDNNNNDNNGTNTSSVRSWCDSTPSSMDSYAIGSAYYTGSNNNSPNNETEANTPLPSLVETKGIFYDELTELTEAFNAMTLELDRQYTHLEDRVRARTKELEIAKIQADAARQQAEKANEAKTVFIANISHELRTPLNGILGMTSVAMEEKDIKKIQNSLELIFRSGELLLHILIQLLTFSKNQLDKSKLQKKNFQVIEVASQIKSIFGKTAKDQDVNLIISLKPNLIRKLILFGDANRIIQVVMNLVSNSLKFTPENGTVRVLIQILGLYDDERSKEANYEKVYIKGLPNDTEHYPVSQLNTPGTLKQNNNSSSDTSSIISSKSSSTLATLHSSVYIKSLSSLYNSPDCDVEYFNDDEFLKGEPNNDFKSNHKTQKCYKFNKNDVDKPSTDNVNNNLNNNAANWVIRFSVSDNGTGIEKSLQDKIFDAFVQGDQTLSRSHGGTGLGLSICKQFAKMMHGTLTLNSEVGIGSTFTFTIPLPQIGEIILTDEEFEQYTKDEFNEQYNKKKKVTFTDDTNEVKEDCDFEEDSHDKKNQMNLATSYEPSSDIKENRSNSNLTLNAKQDNISAAYEKPELITRASTGTAHSYKSKNSNTSSEHLMPQLEEKCSNLKFLVAEDNSVNQEVVKRMLHLEGIDNVSMARDGRDAVEFVRDCINTHGKPFDLILMDVQMPNMDGLSATKIIRKELGYNGPIVALTAFADVSNEKGCIDAGMSGFLSKPIRRTLLRNVMKQFCSQLNTPVEVDETNESDGQVDRHYNGNDELKNKS